MKTRPVVLATSHWCSLGSTAAKSWSWISNRTSHRGTALLAGTLVRVHTCQAGSAKGALCIDVSAEPTMAMRSCAGKRSRHAVMFSLSFPFSFLAPWTRVHGLQEHGLEGPGGARLEPHDAPHGPSPRPPG